MKAKNVSLLQLSAVHQLIKEGEYDRAQELICDSE